MNRGSQWLHFGLELCDSWHCGPNVILDVLFSLVMCVYLSILHVPSRSNGYLEKVGGMYKIVIGTLNAPSRAT